jgi:hypothetical protein
MRRLLLLIVTLASLSSGPSALAAEFDQYGIKSVDASLSTVQAGDHPELVTSFTMKTDSVGFPFARTRDLEVDLPPGLLANLGAFPRCRVIQFQEEACPFDSQLGIVDISAYSLGSFIEPLYYLVPGPDTVARLGYFAGLYPNVINVRVRSESDYGATASVEGVLSSFPPVTATTIVWAVPADKSHDALRITPQEAMNGESPPGGGRPSSLPPFPLTVNPTRCGVPLEVSFTATSYQLPDQPSSMSAPLSSIAGCGKLAFSPGLTVTPGTREAAAATGVDVGFELPQNETVDGLATSHVRHARVVFPKGMTIAAGAADGQEACSSAQAGYKSRQRAQCPDASKLGTAEIDVPALERSLQGALYLRTPEPGNLFRVWFIADDLGLHLALPGELEVDKATGQVTSALLEMPQAPVREAKIHVFGGSRGPLATPQSCGTYQTGYEFTPWSGTPAVKGISPMMIDQSCDTGGFSPQLSSGTVNPVAGAFSGFVAQLTRTSGEQNIVGLQLTLPPGASAKLAGVTLCEGAATQTGDCPVASRIGKATVASGPGPSPLWLPQPGREPIEVFLAGPYNGAPYSLVVKAPAQAGPFDLGTVVTRAAIDVHPRTARATISSDPLPQILEGVPITYRTIHVDVDRPNFTLNPTSCEEMALNTRLTSDKGTTATPSSRFQVGGCRDLGFKPRLSLRLFGKTNRGAHPKLRAVLRARKGDANIRRIQVALPRSAFLDQSHIRTVCTRVQFAAEQCPEGSIYGHVRAVTPLLDNPLEGPVYLRSSNNPLPDLVVALKGQVEIEAVGRIDSVRGGIRTTFAAVPDAPITKVVLTMHGGSKGLLINSRNLCQATSHADVKLKGHNGKSASPHPILQNDCAEKRNNQETNSVGGRSN